MAHCRSSGFASVSDRPSGLCHQRPKATPSASREGQRQAQGCETSCTAPTPAQRCSRRGHVVAQAALADPVSAVALEEFPRGQHWQVSLTALVILPGGRWQSCTCLLQSWYADVMNADGP